MYFFNTQEDCDLVVVLCLTYYTNERMSGGVWPHVVFGGGSTPISLSWYSPGLGEGEAGHESGFIYIDNTININQSFNVL